MPSVLFLGSEQSGILSYQYIEVFRQSWLRLSFLPAVSHVLTTDRFSTQASRRLSFSIPTSLNCIMNKPCSEIVDWTRNQNKHALISLVIKITLKSQTTTGAHDYLTHQNPFLTTINILFFCSIDQECGFFTTSCQASEPKISLHQTWTTVFKTRTFRAQCRRPHEEKRNASIDLPPNFFRFSKGAWARLLRCPAGYVVCLSASVHPGTAHIWFTNSFRLWLSDDIHAHDTNT